MAEDSTHPRTGRHAAALALAVAAERFPDLPPGRLNVEGLTPAEARLAVAIHRTVLQRWLTLDQVLNHFVRQRVEKLDPPLRAVLLAAAAQILFMQRLPDYAVVDESVSLARQMVRQGAAGLANAVLRKLVGAVAAVEPDQPWQPARDRLPLNGGSLRLSGDLLPPLEPLEEHLAAATSHPAHLVRRWIAAHGPEAATQIAWHGTLTPPTLVAVEAEFGRAAEDPRWSPHEQEGFLVWRGTHGELVDFLAGQPRRRVQDPASAAPVASVRELEFATVLDYCAGRGTKTRQLAVEHPGARIFASDPHEGRLADLEDLADELPDIEPLFPEVARASKVDLLLLDVPCSNTGVLARRPEARYRFTRRTLRSVTDLQKQILQQSLPTLAEGGHLLYSTCSIDPAENQEQVQWLVERRDMTLLREQLLLPGGTGDSDYHDGGYHALLVRG